jgi:hypothetical protein
MKKPDAPLTGDTRVNTAWPIDPPAIGGKRPAPSASGQQVRAAGNIQAQFGNSLSTKPPRRK